MEWNNKYFLCDDLPTTPCPDIGKVLVTGATGYVGGRLIPELIERGYQVRAMVRGPVSPEKRALWNGAEIVTADALDPKSLESALDGIHTAYYLIHSFLLGRKKFFSADARSAITFRNIAGEKKVERIIYLGGLGDVSTRLSSHLRSRMMVGEALLRGNVRTTVLRAAIIIGSGSASYRIIKHLTLNLPVLFLPKWAQTLCQPISIRDIIKYLVGVLELEQTINKTFDIGGHDVLSYEQMFRIFAKCLGKKRLFIPSPLSNANLLANLASLFTPVPAPLTRCLFESINNKVVCQDDHIQNFLPFHTISYREAIVRAMTREEQDRAHKCWAYQYPPAHELAVKINELDAHAKYRICYSLISFKSSSSLFSTICRIEGKEGWSHRNLWWRMCSLFDTFFLRVKSNHAKQNGCELEINDVIGLWQVEDLIKNKMLLLRSEMKLPGRAWLKFCIEHIDQRNRLRVKAYYQTHTFFGKIYWTFFLPFHKFIFKDLLNQIEGKSL